MLKVNVENKNIEKALKELKSKIIKTRQNSHLNDRREFKKKSVVRRSQINRAIHKQKLKTIE